VNDAHGDLINLALVLQDAKWGSWLYRKLRRTLVHEELHKISRVQTMDPRTWMPLRVRPDVGEDDAKRAYWWFVNCWLGRNGVIGTKGYNQHFCARYTANGGIQGVRFAAAVDSIPAWRRRLRQVTILGPRDGFELLERIEDQEGVAIYCDPPYLPQTRGTNHGSARYVHDFEPEDHERLAQLLRRFQRARVVVSYYDHPSLSELYPSWSMQRIEVSKGLSVQGRRGSKDVRVTEVLIVNGPLIGLDRELF
jgi:DNA adenine methylase